MRWLSFWKALIPPAAVPLALWMAVALAGPGGIVEVSDEVEPTFGGTESGETGEDGGSAVVTGNGGEAECFLTVLNDGTQSYLVLQEHVSDAGMPEGGVAGNLNALDKICFERLETPKGNTTSVPGKSGDAPGKSEDVPGESESGPGKSEQSAGNTGGGNANGEGQANADDSGNGAADAPGQNKP